MADLTITTANVKPGSTSTIVERATAGATITPGMALYRGSSGKMLISHCETSAATAVVSHIALTGGADTEPIIVIPALNEIAIGATLTVGQIYILSTSGLICPVSDLATSDWVTIIGYGKSANILDFRPQVTGYQKAA